MSGDFLDSNIFVYLFDRTDPTRRETAERLIHAALTGDYTWKAHRLVRRGQYRALRPLASA